MKAFSKILVFSLIAAFLVAASTFSLVLTSGSPVFPESFYGTLTIDGSPAPAGTHMKGFVGAEDRTFNPPYATATAGQYGSQELDGKFGVLCDSGEQIIFMVEKSPGSGQFQSVEGPECYAAGEVNFDISFSTSGQTCGDQVCNGTESCSSCLQDCGPCAAVCGNSIIEQGEQCDPGQNVPGDCCSANCMFETVSYQCRGATGDCDVAESCTGQSAACPADGVQPNTYVCRQASGQCDVAENCNGTGKTCPADAKSPFSTSCNDGLFCSATDHCDGSGNCVQLTARDCSANNIAGIATCSNNPDSNPFTWDSRAPFTSVCNEATDQCTAGDLTITHACSKASCSAPCETAADCNDGNASTTDTCLGDCSCQHTYLPSCGNGNVESGETCEFPSTSNNVFCGQTTSQCQGTKLGTRDAFGNCNSICGCGQDTFVYSCVAGQCGAQCSVNSDCNDQNPGTIDTCMDNCACQHVESGYCLLITDMKVLNSTFFEDYTIPMGTMYNVQMSTYNSCDHAVSSMQIIQVLKGDMPVNLGTLTSSIQAGQTSVITIGFIMPSSAPPGTGFTANGFNWNHWIDQSPGTFQILSGTSQVGFSSE